MTERHGSDVESLEAGSVDSVKADEKAESNGQARARRKSQIDELRFVARPLQGKRVKMVNSTAVGGGVAEMLNRLVPLLDELGVKTGWEVITGGNDFFEVTKGFHNALHGADFKFTPAAREVFLRNNEQNRH